MMVKEIEIPVPWGKIAAKIWGREGNTKIIMVHGIQDNADSFATLIPLLSPLYCYICIDLPGHGKSSHLPKYIFYNYWDFLLSIYLVIRFFKEDTIILLGHSFGGNIITVYTQMFPNHVSKLILVEGSYILAGNSVEFEKYFKKYTADAMTALHKEPNKTLRTFTYEEGLSISISKRFHGPIYRKPAEILHKRNIMYLDKDKYRLRTDKQIGSIFFPLITNDALNSFAKRYPLTVPTLSIIASHTLPYKFKERIIQLHNNGYSKCITKTVQGNHHVHINTPELVAPLINSFLNPQCHL